MKLHLLTFHKCYFTISLGHHIILHLRTKLINRNRLPKLIATKNPIFWTGSFEQTKKLWLNLVGRPDKGTLLF